MMLPFYLPWCGLLQVLLAQEFECPPATPTPEKKGAPPCSLAKRPLHHSDPPDVLRDCELAPDDISFVAAIALK